MRLGLGLMYAYSGYSIFQHPEKWEWAVASLPPFLGGIITNRIGVDNYLKMQGLGELLLAFIFIAWFIPRRIVKWAAVLAVLEMAAILWIVGVDTVTFRDIGLLGAALALAAILIR